MCHSVYKNKRTVHPLKYTASYLSGKRELDKESLHSQLTAM
jgi:hypothetical protein